MKLFTGSSHDINHHLDASGAYEWWYVDALSPHTTEPWGVVVIIFRGMPMSPAYLAAQQLSQAAVPVQHCGMAVSIYYGHRRVAFAFREIPEEQFSVPGNVIAVDTRHPDVSQALSVRVTLPDNPFPNSSQSPDVATGDPHGWVLVAPRIPAQVELEIAEDGIVMTTASWTGLAYRDHNFGARPLHTDFRDWYWGRVHAEQRSLVFLATPDATIPFVAAGEVSADGTQWMAWSDVRFEARRLRWTMMGLRSGRVNRITGIDHEGRIRVLECWHRWVVENGPFYQRYISEWTLDGTPVGRGTSEYMHAARLGAAWTWPFLRLPFFRQPDGLCSLPVDPAS